MPRRSSGSSFGNRSSSPPRRTATAQRPAPLPQRVQPIAPAQTHSSGGMFSGMGGMLMSGMAFGAGSEVAHQAIRAVTGPGSSQSHQSPVEQQQQVQQQPQQKIQTCTEQMTNFTICLKNHSDISMCQPYLDALKECQRANNLM